MQTVDEMIKNHPFFSGLKPKYTELLGGCASNVHFQEGEVICKEGDVANHFYVLRDGMVAIDINVPAHRAITIQTLEGGEILGWSWLIPPHQWRFSAHALRKTSAFALDGKCLRKKCEEDPGLGYELLTRCVGVLTQRLEATRIQLLDLHSSAGSKL